MKKFDSFYVPSCEKVVITAIKECIFYIPAAECNHIGMPIFRTFDATLNIGDIHQIHGTGSGQREVMFTLAPTDKASHLICGLTWSGDGTWTSWPPHQHEKYLEEVYCYFDMPKPKFGFHISYENSGDVDDMVVHTVYSGTMVQAPWGYHPTVASPGSRNAYLWVLGAFDPTVRRYDLAELDPLRI
jgi:5-deoxy-glucuronate isomerase